MSGLCGWTGFGTGAAENLRLAERMAAPLKRFDGGKVHALAGDATGVALVSQYDAVIHRQDGVLAAVWGRAQFRDPALTQRTQSEGLAKALIGRWRERASLPVAQRAEALCAELSGAFALCLIDEAAGETVLAVDRMGMQPLSWQLRGGTLLFSSSADALIAHPAAVREIDPQSLYNYLFSHVVPGPATVYREQRRLLPGECLVVRNGQPELRRYWRIQFSERERTSFGELKEEFMHVLRQGVRDACNSAEGGKVGAFLSGGTDSSTVAGLLREANGLAKTYSIGFEAEGYDEMEYARIASRHFSTDHHEYYVTPDDVVGAIPQIAAIFDEPFGNASAVPAYYCARMAKADGLTTMLGGDGGDELFGGNERYAKQRIFSLYENVPALLRKAVLEPVVFGMPGGEHIMPVRKARSYIRQASVPMPARLEAYNLLERYGHTQVLTDDFAAAISAAQPVAGLTQTYRDSEAASLINRMLALDLKVTLADNDLPKVNKACELAGMEVAFPFLNEQIVAFSARLTPRQKLKGTTLRYFFKEALRGFLPDEIITKKKHGFGLPFGVWLQRHQALRALAADSLTDLKARNIVRPAFIDDLLGKHLQEHPGYHGTMVWVMMMLEQWFKQREGASGA